MRGTVLDAMRRAYLSFTRGVVMSTDDSKSVQTVAVRLLPQELPQIVERFMAYGHHSVHQKPEQGGAKGAEPVVGFMHGNRSHPIVVADVDRRTKPKNYKAGEGSNYDDQGQYSKIARDGHHRVAKQHTLTAAGDDVRPGATTKPDATFELNEQLAGLSARMAQAEHNIHGLHHVTSRFRQIVQNAIPAVSEVAPILNMDPSGLKPMADAISGIEPAYLQQQIEQALQKFLSPNLGGLSSLLSGGLESSITAMQSQIAGIAASNPVVGQVDDMTQEVADLTSSGADARTISEGTAALQTRIGALTSANPIVGQVAGLRDTLNALIGQAGPGLNFLEPQKRLTQRISKSLRLMPH